MLGTVADMGHVRVMSLVPPEEAAAGGLPNETICGYWEESGAGGAPTFRENPAFVELLHRVIATAALADPSMREAAKRQGEGFLYVIDLRTPDGPQGDVPGVDVVGAFALNRGVLMAGSYQANPDHRLVTSDGAFVLPPGLNQAVVDEVVRLTREYSRPGGET